jgi:DNA-binding winged helix-turn-helix (wHTH) protein
VLFASANCRESGRGWTRYGPTAGVVSGEIQRIDRFLPGVHRRAGEWADRAGRGPAQRRGWGKMSTGHAETGNAGSGAPSVPSGVALNTRFGPFVLDSKTRQLTRNGQEIHLAPKAFDLLLALVQERPRVLSKGALQERLWPATFVAEANLSNLVAEIREALGDRARAPLYIRTVHGFGYAFCGEAAATGATEPQASPPLCWIQWGNRRFPLSAGDHVIGRDPDVSVKVDASTVSRRHAQLSVTAEAATLEDLGSKNGTFRGAERVRSAIQLVDGDAVRIGSQLLTFHTCGQISTETHAEPLSEPDSVSGRCE